MKPNEKDDLAQTEELFDMLQGRFPEGFKIPKGHIPKLTPDQAWTVIWYLGNLYWQVTDHIERCDVCGTIYDRSSGGGTLDYGKNPYSFCDSCVNGEAFTKKMRRNPDKEERQQYFQR